MAKKAKKASSKKRLKKVVSKAADPAANKERTGSENKSGMTVETLKDKQDQQAKTSKIKPGKRLYLNAAKDTLYPEGHPQAASLYCNENKFVPRKEFNALKKGK